MLYATGVKTISGILYCNISLLHKDMLPSGEENAFSPHCTILTCPTTLLEAIKSPSYSF
jgi:hypothetical protein